MVDDKPELNQKLLWLMAIRVLVVASILLPFLVYNPRDPGSNLVSFSKELADLFYPSSAELIAEGPPVPTKEETRILQVLVAGVSIETLIFALLLRILRKHPQVQGYLQLIGDQLLLSLLLYKFGDGIASLSILYFFLIAAGGLLIRRKAELLLAITATVFYSSLAIAHQLPAYRALWAPPSAPAPATGQISGEPTSPTFLERTVAWLKPPNEDDVTGVPLVYNLSIHFVGFFTIAFFTRRLTRDPVLEKRLEKSSRDLARLQVLHRDVIQSISSGLLTTDLDAGLTSLNRAGEEILGRREQALAGQPITATQLFDGESWDHYRQEADRSGQIRAETRLERDGKKMVIGFTVSPLRDGTGAQRGYLLIFQDLSEWRALEEKLRQQDRMAALGQMAAGLAHEVGNPLAAISGSVQLLAGRFEGKASEQKLLDITLRESRRLDRTVKSFLQFARPRDHFPEEFDIAALIAEDVSLLRNSEEVAAHHRIELELAEGPALVVADRDQLGQIFWNLARNALQAMPNGGRLRITGRLEGHYYRLEMEDSGRGMSGDEKARIFQPFKSFFGSGLGLGMAIVYRLVEEHGGEILVDSEPGAGTRIAVLLPVSGEPSPDEVVTAERKLPLLEELPV
jgi:two-component system sensor histidine kinase PilS (NtrC family)